MSDINVTVQDEIVNIDVLDTPVLVNVVNSPGQQGPAGPGVPVGGTAGQILAKASATNYDTEWINNYAKYLATNVRNQTGSTIGAFQVVYISGATGNKPLISLADADTEATSSKTYGVTATSIANNGTGDVVTVGELSGIDTSAFTEGDSLWLSSTAGGVVTSPPAEPAHAVFIGTVIRSHPTLGVIDVAIQNGYELNELHGVEITTPTANQGLFYDGSLWVNRSITTALGYTPVPTTRNITINGVTYDLSADRTWTIATGISGSGASGQVTYWTGASAVSGSNNFTWDNTIDSFTLKTENTTNPNRGFQIQQYGNSIPGAISTYKRARGTIALPSNVLANDLVGLSQYSAYVSGSFTTDRALFGANMATSTGIGLFFIAGSTNGNYIPNLYIHPTGNVVVNGGGSIITGGITDGGQRFQVYGDTLLRGSGTTSATTALTVQDSASSDMLRVRSDSRILIGGASTTAAPSIYAYSGITGNRSLRIGIQSAASLTPTPAFNINQENDYTYTTGTGEFTTITANFLPTSGTGSLAYLTLKGTINQTGGANGITRGLYVNPTLTAAADFRAIETTAGNVLFGSNFFWDNANGRLGIGTNTPSTQLHIAGVNDVVSRIRSSTNTGASSYLAANDINSTFEMGMWGSTRAAYGAISSDNGYLYGSKTLAITSLVEIRFGTGASVAERMRIDVNGNVGIGVTPTVRLQVLGDTLLRGSGNTSATTALTVQNSSSTNLFVVRNDGNVGIGTNAPANALHIQTSSATAAPIQLRNTNSQGFATFYLSKSDGNDAAGFGYVNASNGNANLANRFVFYTFNNTPISFTRNSDFTPNLFIVGTSGNLIVNGDTDVASSRLTINSTTQGFLPPRMTTTQKNAISTPAAGLVVYDTTDNKHYGYDGTTWNAFY